MVTGVLAVRMRVRVYACTYACAADSDNSQDMEHDAPVAPSGFQRNGS